MAVPNTPKMASALPIFEPFDLHSEFIYSGLYVAFDTVQVISQRVVGRAEETSTYSSLGLCTVNCRPTASNHQLSQLRPSRGSNPGLRGGRRGCYHSATVAPYLHSKGNVANKCILFVYLGFYIIFNTVQVISRWVVGRAEEIST